jgi:hypothetical protein
MRNLIPFLCLTATAAAQSVVIPSAAATVRPTRSPFYLSNVFYSTSSTTIPHDSRTQSIVDVADVGVPAALWNSLAVRRPVGLGNANPAMSTTGVIMMSVSPNAWTAATSTFASNHGAAPVTVFNGTINLPAATNPPAWPAPWETPIPFSAPFPFTSAMGLSLVIDIAQTGNSATTPWYVEATSPNNGGRAGSNPSAQSTCRFSNNNYNNSLGHVSQILVGGTWYVNYGSILPNAIGVAAIGAQGVGGSWNGIPLPFDMSGVGAPGCSWNISMDYIVGIAASASGSAPWPVQQVPNDPSLAGAFFFDQAIFVDSAANALGLVASWSSKWEIGTGIGAPGALVAATGSAAANPAGFLTRGQLPTLQLNP